MQLVYKLISFTEPIIEHIKCTTYYKKKSAVPLFGKQQILNTLFDF